jgi:hypothetical protein
MLLYALSLTLICCSGNYFLILSKRRTFFTIATWSSKYCHGMATARKKRVHLRISSIWRFLRFKFYDSPRQLICFWRTFFRVSEADLLPARTHILAAEPIQARSTTNAREIQNPELFPTQVRFYLMHSNLL